MSRQPELPFCPSLLHFHIPKTGGTSLRRLLLDNLSVADLSEAVRLQTLFVEQIETPNLPRMEKGLLSGHLPMRVFHNFDSPVLSIVTLREPASLCRSIFHHQKREGIVPPAMSFQEFLFSGGARVLCNFQCRWLVGTGETGIAAGPSLPAQTGSHDEIFTDCRPFLDDRYIETACDALRKFTYVLLTERLDEGFRRLVNILGMVLPVDLAHANRTTDRTADDELDYSGRMLLHTVTAGDRKLYKLAAGIYDEQWSRPSAPKCSLFGTGHLRTGVDEIWSRDFSFPIAGEGWHQRELDQTWLGFRWSTEKSLIHLQSEFEAGRKYNVKIIVLATVDERNLDESCFVLGDSRLPIRFRREGTIFHGTAEFSPAQSIRYDGLVELHAPYARRPSPISPEVFDPRTLGFAVKWMGIIPCWPDE